MKSKEYSKSSAEAWWILFVSQFFLLIMDITWILSKVGLGISTDFAPVFVLYSLHVVLFSTALLVLPHYKMSRVKTMRRIVDIGIVMCIIFMALWILIVDRIVRVGSSDPLTILITIIFVVLEFMMSYVIIGVFLRNAGQLKDNPVSFLLLAAFLQVVSTAFFGYSLVQGTYIAGGIPDFLMIASYLLMGAASVMQITQKPIKIRDCSSKVWYMNLRINKYITLIFALLAYLMIISIYFLNPDIFLYMLLTASFALALILFRQILQLEEIKKTREIAEENSRIAEENRKIAEANEKKFRAIIDNSIDAIVITTEDNKIAHWNSGAEMIYGYTAQEAINQDISFIMPPELIKPYKNGLAKQISEGNFQNRIVETIGLRKDGERIPLEESVTQWEGENGHIFAAIIRDISERRFAEEWLVKSLEEKNLLLMEIHHRVKNHLQIISSLITLLSFTLDDEATKTIFLELQNRIKTIALIHEILYQTKDISKVDMGSYIDDILKNLSLTYRNTSQRIDLVQNIEDITLNMETATPCGLIINEVVTNSFKYAFVNRTQGEIFIKLERLNGDFLLTISDDGVGLSKEIDMEHSKTLGLRLITNLIKQIGGDLDLNRENGTEFKIKFKEAQYGDRI